MAFLCGSDQYCHDMSSATGAAARGGPAQAAVDFDEEEAENGSNVSCVLVGLTVDGLKMNRHVFALQQVARRTFSSSVRRQLDNKVRQKQKLFQEDNGMPVHLKGGSADALLYRTTMILTVLGAGYVVYELVKAAYPQKKD